MAHYKVFSLELKSIAKHIQPEKKKYWQVVAAGVLIGLLLASLGAKDDGFTIALILTLGPLIFALGSWQAWQNQQSQDVIQVDPHLRELVFELEWMNVNKALDDRSHPSLIPLLDRLASCRQQLRSTLESPEWVQKSKQEPWKSLAESCGQTADEAVFDVLWICRYLFQRKGYRAATFAKRCSDPEFGRKTLDSAEAIVLAMEEMVANLQGEGGRIERAMEKSNRQLHELLAAQRELGERSEFLEEDFA